MDLRTATEQEREEAKVRVLGRPGDILQVDGQSAVILETHLRKDGVWFLVFSERTELRRLVHSSVLEDPSVPSSPVMWGACNGCNLFQAETMRMESARREKERPKAEKTPARRAVKKAKKAVKKAARKATKKARK